MRKYRSLMGAIIGSLLGLTSTSVNSANWPQFLGPGGKASAHADALPDQFGPDKHLWWKVDAAAGNSSPIIWGDYLFLSGYAGKQRLMQAIDRTTGKLLWEKSVEAREEESFTHRLSGPAESTPCTDGEVVYFYFGNYGLIALSFDGMLLWEKQLPKPRTGMGTGTSPILYEDLLILNRDGTNDPCILALDKSTGEEIWKHPRIGYNSSHATPFVWTNSLRTELVVAGTRSLVSLDPNTGRLIWKVDDTNAFPCTTPTADGDLLLFAAWSANNANSREKLEAHFDDALNISDEEMNDPKLFFSRFDANGDGSIVADELPPSRAKDVFKWLDRNDNQVWEQEEFSILTRPGGRGRNIMVAIRAGGQDVLNGTEHIAWEWRKHLPYVASPLVSDGRVYLVKSMGLVSALDTQTGKPLYSGERTGEKGEYFSSPIKVGNRILICSNFGTVYVLRDQDSFEIVATNRLNEEIVATPAVADNTLYLRTRNSLWAFKEDQH